MTRHRYFILTLLALTLFAFSNCHTENDTGQNHSILNDSTTTTLTPTDNQPLITRLIKNTDRDIFISDTTATNIICSQHLDYLGDFHNTNGETTFKIMTILTEWGLDCRTTSRILVYNNTDDYLGNYYTDGILPTQIMDNGLLFDGLTIGDFTKSIPDSLQIDDNFWTRFEKKNGL